MALSYSAIKQYENCPRQYYEVRVLKKHPRQETEATIWGTKVHEAAELYIRDGLKFSFDFPGSDMVVALKARQGVKHCELELAVDGRLQPVEFNDESAIIRGIADLVIINDTTIRVCDYKTGSAKYPDVAQLELMALMLFPRFPEVTKSKGALLFLAHNTIVSSVTERDQVKLLWANWFGKINRIERACETEVWNPKSSGLCPWCPVTSCEHWHEKPQRR